MFIYNRGLSSPTSSRSSSSSSDKSTHRSDNERDRRRPHSPRIDSGGKSEEESYRERPRPRRSHSPPSHPRTPHSRASRDFNTDHRSRYEYRYRPVDDFEYRGGKRRRSHERKPFNRRASEHDKSANFYSRSYSSNDRNSNR